MSLKPDWTIESERKKSIGGLRKLIGGLIPKICGICTIKFVSASKRSISVNPSIARKNANNLVDRLSRLKTKMTERNNACRAPKTIRIWNMKGSISVFSGSNLLNC